MTRTLNATRTVGGLVERTSIDRSTGWLGGHGSVGTPAGPCTVECGPGDGFAGLLMGCLIGPHALVRRPAVAYRLADLG